MNKGKYQIISGNTLFEKENDKERTYKIDNFFKGVIVNLEFNTNDNNMYIVGRRGL